MHHLVKYIFIVLLLPFTAYAQYSNGYLENRNNAAVITGRPLTMADFRGKAQTGTQNTAETRSVVGLQKVRTTRLAPGRVKIDFVAKPYFLYTSWINLPLFKGDQEEIDYVVAHEQSHYNLTILAAIELERALDSKPYFSASGSEKEIGAIFGQIMDRYEWLNKIYESETRNGLKEGYQRTWNRIIGEALAAKSWANLERYVDAKYYRPEVR